MNPINIWCDRMYVVQCSGRKDAAFFVAVGTVLPNLVNVAQVAFRGS